MAEIDVPSKFTIPDMIGVVYVALNILGIFFFSYAAIRLDDAFNKFGGELSAITTLMTNPWLLIFIGIISIIIFSLTWNKRIGKDLKTKRLLVLTAFILTSITIALCFVGVFLPLLKLASPALLPG